MEKDPIEAGVWLLFDGDCGFCQRWVNWAKRRGAEEAVRFEPCQLAVEVRQRAGIEVEECSHSAILVEVGTGEGAVRVHRAAAAINGVLRRLPGWRNVFWRVMSAAYHIPGLRQLEEWVYGMIARRRHRFGGGSCARDARSH